MANVKRNQLSTLKVKNISTPGAYVDGGGLELRVHKSGGKNWVLRLTIRGKRRNFGLGGYPGVSLKEARAEAEEIRHRVRRGLDPMTVVLERPTVPTLAEVSESVIELRAPTWTSPGHESQWRESLGIHVIPRLGSRPVDTIAPADVLAVLLPIWTVLPETARRVRQRLGVIFDFAIAAGYRVDNPANAVKAALPRDRRRKRHHPALPYEEVTEAINAIRKAAGRATTKLAMEFLILTASRTSEVLGATWDEVDLSSATWAIPAHRMKMRVEHRVPLSTGALAVLEQARKRTSGKGLVFPSDRNLSRALSQPALLKLLNRVGYGHVTSHGFRSSFRNWTLEQTDASWAVCEAALAHKLGGDEVVAYARSDLFERRKGLMQDWSDYALGIGFAEA